jgi:hypothetical protein
VSVAVKAIPCLRIFTFLKNPKPFVIVESKFDPVHVSTGTGDDFIFETSIEVSGGILTDLHSGQVFPPWLNGDLSPGFGYFTFGKFWLESGLH